MLLSVDISSCKLCNKLFIRKHARHSFCSSKCSFEFNKKQRLKVPIFVCPSCFFRMELTFRPKSNKKSWNEFSCPACGYSISNQFQDFKAIKEIKREFRQEIWINTEKDVEDNKNKAL